MIKAVENEHAGMSEFCNRDVFGTRIKAYWNCYGSKYDFVKFWIQTDENEKVISAISRVDGDMTICSNGENAEELAQFVTMAGYATIQCEKSVAEKMNMSSSLDGYVVEYKGNEFETKDICTKNTFELKEIYDIIKSANLVGVGDYLPWLSDTSFRTNRGVTEAKLATSDGENAGCAMVLFRTDSASLLGGVATCPEHRGKGIAGTLVVTLAEQEKAKGNRVELLCKHDSIVEFYRSIGFIATNEWSIITNEAEFL